MKKKSLVIGIIAILLVIIIIGAIVIGLLLNKNKSVGSKWGDTYYAYLSEAINEKDLDDAYEKYGIQSGMKNAKLQFCEVEENEAPSMIMTYEQSDNQYVNVYQITDDDKVNFISYKQPTDIEFLYNIEKDDYIWYIHKFDSNSDSYSSLNNIVNNLKENAKQSDKSKNINIAELEADYTIKKDETEIAQETVEGEKLSISKFDTIFVKPDVKLNKTIDFDVNISEKDLKEKISKVVDNYKSEDKILTDSVKDEVSKKAEETKEKVKKIEEAKEAVIKEEEKKKAEEAKGLKVGKHTLKYGIYVSDVAQMDKECYGTITLKPDGKFHIKSNYDESRGTIEKNNIDCDGTYEVKLNQPTGYPDDYADYIVFKPDSANQFSFEVIKDNSFSDQWHGYNFSTSANSTTTTNATSNSTSTQKNNTSTSSTANVPSGIEDVYKDYVKNKEYEKYTKDWMVKPANYCMYDINQDGQKELLISSDNDMGWEYVQICTYSKSSNKVIEVANIYAYGGLRYSKNDKQIVYTEVKPFTGAMGYGFYEMKNNKLALVKSVGSDDIDSYFIEIEGQKMQHVTNDECKAQFNGLIYFEYSKL